jgi:GMP synthase (glutamine-hydrolysing)
LKRIATSENAPYAVIADEARRFYGVQFHPEVVHTPRGATLLIELRARHRRHPGDWNMNAFRAEDGRAIRAQVGSGKVICGLSGRRRLSAVAAVLIHEAIGDQLTCIFVDHGLMRSGEAKKVVSLFRDHYNIPLIHADASRYVPGRLAGVTDPEAKRKTIGAALHRRVRGRQNKLGGADFLAQGTLYPDVIESVSRPPAGHPSRSSRITMSAACRTHEA